MSNDRAVVQSWVTANYRGVDVFFEGVRLRNFLFKKILSKLWRVAK